MNTKNNSKGIHSVTFRCTGFQDKQTVQVALPPNWTEWDVHEALKAPAPNTREIISVTKVNHDPSKHISHANQIAIAKATYQAVMRREVARTKESVEALILEKLRALPRTDTASLFLPLEVVPIAYMLYPFVNHQPMLKAAFGKESVFARVALGFTFTNADGDEDSSFTDIILPLRKPPTTREIWDGMDLQAYYHNKIAQAAVAYGELIGAISCELIEVIDGSPIKGR